MQNPRYGEDRIYRRKLFYDNGVKWLEVKAKQIVEYVPPTPILKSHVNQTLTASAGIVTQGTSHYTSTLTMIFYSKRDYAEWLQYIGSEHKYLDEKGTVYLGAIGGTPKIETASQESKYIVSVELLLVRKQDFEDRIPAPWIDMDEHWSKDFVTDMHERGLIAEYTNDGNGVQYFRPEDGLKRSEGCAFLVRTYKYLNRTLRGY